MREPRVCPLPIGYFAISLIAAGLLFSGCADNDQTAQDNSMISKAEAPEVHGEVGGSYGASASKH